MEMNGGSVVAMIGKDCVAIASDLRLGQQAVGLASNFEKVSHERRVGVDWGACGAKKSRGEASEMEAGIMNGYENVSSRGAQ